MTFNHLPFRERINRYEKRLDELCSILEQKSSLGYPIRHIAIKTLHITPEDWQSLVIKHAKLRECIRRCDEIRRDYFFKCRQEVKNKVKPIY